MREAGLQPRVWGGPRSRPRWDGINDGVQTYLAGPGGRAARGVSRRSFCPKSSPRVGFRNVRRAAETPFHMILEARP